MVDIDNVSLATILKKYPQQLPRYTSYPTAPHFYPLDSHIYCNNLKSLNKKQTLSLYIHIPFCQKLCWFCGCNTKIIHNYNPIKEYMHCLKHELQMFSSLMKNKMKISHIHFGGGSPTLLNTEDFSSLMKEIHNNFIIEKAAQIAIEIDPRTVNEAKIACYAKQGINRVSLGIQDFSLTVQRAINRIQPFNLVYQTTNLLRQYGIDEINFDLIYGLPQQNLSNIQETVELSLSLQPMRIALFGYAHVPWKKKNMNLIDEPILPSEEMRLNLYTKASQMILKDNYIKIGLDHFAKPNDPMSIAYKHKKLSRNFQGYSVEHADTLIGFGVSAISNLDTGYFQNSTTIEEYKKQIDNGVLPITKGYILSKQDKINRHIIEQLMCYFSYDTNQLNLDELIINKLTELASDNLICFNQGIIEVNREIPQAIRIVCSLFDEYLDICSSNKHSKVA